MTALPLRILILEDRATDAELITRALSRAGLVFTSRRVDRRDDFVREVVAFAPDLVLADFTLPGFDAIAALDLARKLGPPVPFIVVTGRVDEETAAACLKAGVDDFVLKDHLTRLAVAVQAALSAHRARLERRRVEEVYRDLAENSLQGLVIFQEQRVALVNQAFCDMVGYSVEEIQGVDFARFQEIVHPDDRALVWGRYRERSVGKDVPQRYEFRVLHRDGSTRWLEMRASNVLYGQRPSVQATLVDVTERRRVEQELRDSRALLRQVIDSVPRPFFWADRDLRYLGVNQHFADWAGAASPDAVVGRRDADLCWAPEQSAWLRACAEATLAAAGAERACTGELRLADGRTQRIVLRLVGLRDETGACRGVIGVFDPDPPAVPPQSSSTSR